MILVQNFAERSLSFIALPLPRLSESMMKINFPKAPMREPTKKEMKLFNKWVVYLSDSRLSKDEVYKRAAEYTTRGEKIYD